MTFKNILEDINEVKTNHNKYLNKKITQEDYFTFLTGIANKYNIPTDLDETPKGTEALEQEIIESLIMFGVAI